MQLIRCFSTEIFKAIIAIAIKNRLNSKCWFQLNSLIMPPQVQGTIGKKCNKIAMMYSVKDVINAIVAFSPAILVLSTAIKIAAIISIGGKMITNTSLNHEGNG